MVLDADAAYLALKSRDARFDGRLFVGVTSTGIYCRPVCRVRTPRRENCRFFSSAAQAEAATFRPCLKCRPEIAPGLSAMDSSRTLADEAARRLAHAVATGEEVSVAALARRLGVTDRHLRRIFHAAHGVAPQDWLTTQRLLLAKQLLTETAEPVAQVALASGFGSLRRFNAAFAERYRMAPGQLRRQSTDPGTDHAASGGEAGATVRLAWRPPLDSEALFGFLGRRALGGVEEWAGGEFRRTLAVSHRGVRHAGWLRARLDEARNELRVELSPGLAGALGAVTERLREAFDLDADPLPIDAALAALPVPRRAGTRVPGAFDGFESTVRIVLGQQVTVKAACTLAARLVARFGLPVATPFAGLTHLFPTPQSIADASADAIGSLGIVGQRVRALQALAQAVTEGRLELGRHAALEEQLAVLRDLPGFGEWTVQLVAMRVLGWPDAWPATDIGLMNALGSRDVNELQARAEAWRPWRSYAVIRLWHHLENPS